MFEKLPGPRHTTTEEADGLAIRIPARCNYLKLAFLSLWLCGWAFGMVMGTFGFFSGMTKNPASGSFMVIWLSAWTIGGGCALFTWLWQLKGCEIITVSPDALSVRHDIFGCGRTKHYDASEIRDLRVAPFTYIPGDFRNGFAFWGFGGGTIAFDYGYKTFRFGAGIDEAEARIIVDAISARAPRLAHAA
jgi:hypothetical protein